MTDEMPGTATARADLLNAISDLRVERDAARAEAERLREESRRDEQSRSDAYQRLIEDRDKYLEAWHEAVAEASRVREALQAVRDLHERTELNRSTAYCAHCAPPFGWPCPTVRALDAALGSHPDESENPTKEMDHA